MSVLRLTKLFLFRSPQRKALEGKKLQNTEVKVEGLDDSSWIMGTQTGISDILPA